MKLSFTPHFTRSYNKAPPNIQKAFDKQSSLLLRNMQHPSLRAKKYNEAEDKWQGRVTGSWRFYFKIVDDSYVMQDITRHPK
jgi:mRNA-degrading endonuclease RelE of RelBE toxin-antitoxin system